MSSKSESSSLKSLTARDLFEIVLNASQRDVLVDESPDISTDEIQNDDELEKSILIKFVTEQRPVSAPVVQQQQSNEELTQPVVAEKVCDTKMAVIKEEKIPLTPRSKNLRKHSEYIYRKPNEVVIINYIKSVEYH